ncbi:sigma-70 family RNA polymerase sigma factor [Actinophytocola sp.]|uniref:sigma-70 family RNA polymerase sigma factor n=1 Tax=Actinophytocola sp. TaxID=1872138 RepID=UPI002D7EB997|nr:sigma-70 family RNA polymerase sigma factor [Actinophytocola sp.]HET9141655.1 sigma-70 family RNA polymerase sigma factor [Actinophytocola sp.]
MPAQEDAEALLHRVARGDEVAFARLYDILIGPVFGLVRRVLRDEARSEELATEVMVALWQTASRYSPERGSVLTWALTLAHRRAVDRVRREEPPGRFDEVGTLREDEQVGRCLGTLTDAQRKSVVLTYYGGRNYREVAELLGAPLGGVKAGLRDGLIRLRDCPAVTR